jgi:integrase
MPQTLTHAFISKPLAPRRYFDTTSGLHLYVKSTGRKYWVFRYTAFGKRHDLGLGPYPAVSLSDAREAATNARLTVRKGGNPMRVVAPPTQPRSPLFEDFAEEFISMNEAQWQNPKHVDQWRNTLRDYAYPHIGKLTVDKINTDNLLTILRPLWTTKTETASRLRGRIERILGSATARGLRAGMNPAQWRGHLEHTLPPSKRIKKVKHHAALPYKLVNKLIMALQEKECVSALALEFLILTASRTGEIRLARWHEVHGDIWVIPADRMKAKREHKVPLNERCLHILQVARNLPGSSDFIFHRNGHPLSNVAMSKLLAGISPGYTVHGFRSSFRDWVAEETEHSGDVAEMALAHRIPNAVEAAYRRGDLLGRRRSMMNDWGNHCCFTPALSEIQSERKAA